MGLYEQAYERLPLIVNLLSLRRSRAGGAETYATELVPRLLEQWQGETMVMVRDDAAAWLGSLGWRPGSLRPVASRGSGSLSVVTTAVAARRLVSEREAVVFSPFNIHTSGALRSRELVGVHDLLSYHYLAGEWGRLDPRTWAVLKAKSVALGDAVTRAGAVVVHTETMREDLLRFVPKVDPSRVHLVALGADPAEPVGGARVLHEPAAPTAGPAGSAPPTPGAAPVAQPFVLLVGSSTWRHKNLDLAIEMARTATFEKTDARLVIVGRVVPDVPAGLEGRVLVMRDISNADLASLYARCNCLMFPSTAEGFGLPLVEAMHHGVPCVVSDIAVFRELAGDAARYFDPTSPEAAADAVADVLTHDSTSRSLRMAGPERSAGFTWDACAAGYLKELLSLADS